MQKFSTEAKIFLGIILGTMVLIGGAALLLGGNSSTTSSTDISVLVHTNSHTIGPADAKVTVVEFSDFECPACQAAQPILDQIMATYKDKKVRFVYREFPLPIHQYAFLAAQAAESAGLQGKFWEMHDLLFKTFESSKDYTFDKNKALDMAKALGLDVTKFGTDFDSDAVRQTILNDQADGNKAGLTVTPTFFINGTKFDGVLQPDEFKKEIDSRLK